MGVPTRRVKKILQECETDVPSGRGDGYRVAAAADIAVPYKDGYAITVLWRGKEDR